MTAEAGSEDQSMEEILQSIKRIIAEEDEEQPEGEAKADAPVEEPAAEAEPEPAPEAKEEKAEAPVEEPSDVLELTEIVQDDGTTVNVDQAEPEAPKEEAPAEPVEQEPVMADDKPSDPVGDIISDEAAAASAAALKELADQAPKEEPVEMPKVESPAFRSGNTVEDLVLEALRPMLKEWIDANLPSMVEAMVQKEIKKISGQ